MINKDIYTETNDFQSTVLIVDDDKQQLEILSDCMENFASTIITASNGIEALSKAREELPNIILLDVMMPKMNGFDVCSQLKEDPRTKDIPVIFITALNDLNSILKGFSLGGVDYITKPYHTQEIISRLQTHIKLQYQHRKLMELSLELKASKEEAESARIVAEKANQAKTNFLCVISHELMTPMSVIQSLTHFALETELNSKQTEYLEKIKKSSGVLKELIDDILEYSNIESGKAVVNKELFEINAALAYVKNILSTRISDQKKLQLMISLDPMVPKFLKGDSHRIQKVLIHLGDNAIKFTSSGYVKIKVRLLEKNAQKASIIFSVKDSGIGMTKQQQEFIFQPFTQANMSKNRQFEGVGLGLALCRQMIKIMNGKLSVHSQPNEGSLVTFQLDLLLPEEKMLSMQEEETITTDTKNLDEKNEISDQNKNDQLKDLLAQLEVCIKKRNPKKCEEVIQRIKSIKGEIQIFYDISEIQDFIKRYQFEEAQEQLILLTKSLKIESV